jgi:hypothetical protein
MLRKLIHIRPRNQSTLPQELVFRWEVLPGDYLRAQISDDGKVSLAPARLAVEGSPEADEQNRQAEKDIEAGRYRTFEDVKGFCRFSQRRASRGDRGRPALCASGYCRRHRACSYLGCSSEQQLEQTRRCQASCRGTQKFPFRKRARTREVTESYPGYTTDDGACRSCAS